MVLFLMIAMLAGLVPAQALAGDLVFTDPVGDDNGPGTYVYPTDQVYTAGSFDLVELKVEDRGSKLDLDVTVNANLDDPWRMEVGFAVQMVFIFIDTDGKDGSGFTTGVPGTNIAFAPSDAWDRCIILSPQSSSRVKQEVRTKAGDMADAIVVPSRTRGSGRTISASVKKKDLGEGDPASWGYQVVMQSNEGFPDKADLLTRKVNEFEGQHRFGGGTDYDCDPHVMDVLAGKAVGDPSEVEAQHAMLAYECDDEGNAVKMATLTMVHATGQAD
jgi:carbohydrate-binding DOMON domain-containing protein